MKVLSVLALCIPGCVSLDLGDAPFFCANANPPCPSGYRCETQAATPTCVREGYDPVLLDAGADSASEDASPGDGGVLPNDGVQPPSGTLIVTEFMANPKAVTDGNGEYFELFNLSDAPIDINGWTLKDEGSDSHTIDAGGPLLVDPGVYLVLGSNADLAQNGRVNVAYAYTEFFLSNTEDEVILIDRGGKFVDKFVYAKSQGFNITEGSSLSVKGPFVDKSDGTNWCVETNTWPGSVGDTGTPGSGPGCK